MPSGTGPGPITEDGCAVALYALLPVGDEADVVATLAAAGSSVLELGCGAGRVTHRLVELGYDVVAVDSSADMLAHVHGATTIQVTIEELRLHQRFDVVVLGSQLVNTPLTAERAALLATCARHVAPEGVVLVERHAPAWFDTVDDSWGQLGDVRMRLTDIRRTGDELSATAEYQHGSGAWTQTFVARRLGDDQLAEELAWQGLLLDGFVDVARRWARARLR